MGYGHDDNTALLRRVRSEMTFPKRVALAAALLLGSTAALADGLVDNVDGVTVTAKGEVARLSPAF